jgi:hypothetical protein
MTNTSLSNVTLPAEKEVEAAVQGQRALAAFLATGFETQRIQIFDEKNQAHQVIVTCNEKDFPAEVLSHYAMETQHPDVFAENVFDLHPIFSPRSHSEESSISRA